MRCLSCSTQNEPDSRFCGGCGARMAVTGNTLAATEKIASDSPLAVQPLASIPPGQIQRRVSTAPEMPAPASMGPGIGPGAGPGVGLTTRPGTGANPSARLTGPSRVTGPSAAPPQAPAVVPTGSASRRVSVAREASMEMPVARTRWGLVIALVLLDLALAGAGGWMLSQGLRTGTVTTPATVPSPPRAKTAEITTGPGATPTAEPTATTPGARATAPAPGASARTASAQPDVAVAAAGPAAASQAMATAIANANATAPSPPSPIAGPVRPPQHGPAAGPPSKSRPSRTRASKHAHVADGPEDPYAEPP